MKTHWPLFVLFQRRNWNCRKDGWLTSLWKYFQKSPINKTIPQKTMDKGMIRYSGDIAEVWKRKLYFIYTFNIISIIKNYPVILKMYNLCISAHYEIRNINTNFHYSSEEHWFLYSCKRIWFIARICNLCQRVYNRSTLTYVIPPTMSYLRKLTLIMAND